MLWAYAWFFLFYRGSMTFLDAPKEKERKLTSSSHFMAALREYIAWAVFGTSWAGVKILRATLRPEQVRSQRNHLCFPIDPLLVQTGSSASCKDPPIMHSAYHPTIRTYQIRSITRVNMYEDSKFEVCFYFNFVHLYNGVNLLYFNLLDFCFLFTNEIRWGLGL